VSKRNFFLIFDVHVSYFVQQLRLLI